MQFILFLLAIFIPVLNIEARKKHHRQNKPHHLYIDDFSHLNKTEIKQTYTPESYEELARIVRYAAQTGVKISVAGSQHSQGGHSFCPNGIVIFLKKFNKIVHIDAEQKIMTVQAGATWKEVQHELNKRGFAVKIMQFINMVTVGGALSVNANGINPHCGPFIESVRSFKIMRADGTIITASRTENPQLFALAIGGYGLFGIVLEITLDISENNIYRRSSQLVSLEEYASFARAVSKNSAIGFHIGQVVLDPYAEHLLAGIQAIQYTHIDEKTITAKRQKQLKKLHKERFVNFKKWGISFLRSSDLAKKFQKPADSSKDGALLSRNTIMSPPASHVYHNSRCETDLLQEYFIPIQNFSVFMQSLERYTRELDVNLMHVNVRFIPQSDEGFLSYLRGDSIGVVVLFTQKVTDSDCQKIKKWTQHLIDAAIVCKGTYYLPIQLHADQTQIRKAYPRLDAFFEAKKLYDPCEIFMNHFYQKYSSCA